jgi:chitinase
VQIATTKTTSFTSSQLSPATTYFYAVQSTDTAGNTSTLSGMVPVTTLGLPASPSSLTAEPLSTSQITVSWSAVGGSLPAAKYYIYAGTSPSSLTQVASTVTLSYVHRSLLPGTTYYYAIRTADAAGDLSPLSPAVRATT